MNYTLGVSSFGGSHPRSLERGILAAEIKYVNLKRSISQLNIPSHCGRQGLSLWQCPQFLFLVMGAIIIASAVLTYAIGIRYVEDPAVIALVVLFLTTVLFIIAFAVVHGFERLAETNRMKSEFISVVSHQLRAPLSNLKWAIDFLMSGRLGAVEKKQVEYFKILKENSYRMEELVSDLLTVSRIEQKTLPINKKEISLEELINNLILEFKPLLYASNAEVEFKTQEHLPRIVADQFQIRLVVENLLDNAIRYIKKKGEIKIKLEKKRKNLYFEIKDNGVGIPEEDQKYIFQKFFRSENTLRYQTQGFGLGLYITKAIVEKLGGKIGFESKENKGSKFWVILPQNK